MCRLLEEGGLCIRILRVFSDALLGKWVWKSEIEKSSLWYMAFFNRYKMSNENLIPRDSVISVWWKDINQLTLGS